MPRPLKLWQPAPYCRVFAGEHSLSGSLPFDWGRGDADADAAAPVMTAARPEEGAPGVRSVGSALVLFDMRRGHKMFYHYQVRFGRSNFSESIKQRILGS